MFCSRCGAKLFDSDRFCSECGAVVEALVKESITDQGDETIRVKVRDYGDETIRVNAIEQADATVRESKRVPESAPSKQKSAPVTKSSSPAVQNTDFDYGDFATYNKKSESDSSSAASSSFDYAAGFSSRKTVSYRENEINRSLFMTIAAGYGIFYILYQVVSVFLPRIAGVGMPTAFYQIASIVLGIAYIVYLAGAFLCVNKTPLTHMIAYVIPLFFPVVMFFINIAFFNVQFMVESLISVIVPSLGTIVFIALFALLTNESIINVTHPAYPIGLLFVFLSILAIGSALPSYFYQRKLSFEVYYNADMSVSLLSIVLSNFISKMLTLVVFSAVQLFERRREA